MNALVRKMNYIYLVRCADDTLYCGSRSRLPVELVYHEEYDDRHEALSREWHIKRMSREEKMKLIEGANT